MFIPSFVLVLIAMLCSGLAFGFIDAQFRMNGLEEEVDACRRAAAAWRRADQQMANEAKHKIVPFPQAHRSDGGH